jgi:hypothetical protein
MEAAAQTAFLALSDQIEKPGALKEETSELRIRVQCFGSRFSFPLVSAEEKKHPEWGRR